MTITASTRPSGAVGQAPVLVLSGSAAVSVRVDLVAGIPSVLVDGQALFLAGIGPVSGVDAGGISGTATLRAQDDGQSSVLTGSPGSDTLIGGGGNDTLSGGGGTDRIFANGGDDTLSGGLGNDVFVIGGGGSGRVTITDFKPGDRIAFNGPSASGDQPMPIFRWEVGSTGEGFFGSSVALEQIAGGVRFHAFMDNVAGADYTVDVLGNFTLAGWRAGVGASYSEVEFIGSLAKPVEGPVGTDSEDIITGGAGRDLLVGKGADDLLNGGAGIDAAGFTGNWADYVIAGNPNGSFTVTDRLGRDGTDSLTDIELLRFADRVVPLGTIALQSQVGTTRVDEAFYRSQYPDIAQAIQIGSLRSGAEHFAHYGQAEGRQPNAYSDAQGRIYSEFWYLATNSDVAAAVDRGQFDSGYEHYARFGKAEGRGAFPAGRVPDIDLMFDASSYLSANPDLRGTPWSLRPYEHFLLYGFSEGRDPNLFFDVDWYLDRNPDVAAGIRQGLIGSAIEHYSRYGWREGRDPSAAFDISAYQDRYPDIRAAGVDPMLHYLGWGFAEGRVITAADTAWIG